MVRRRFVLAAALTVMTTGLVSSSHSVTAGPGLPSAAPAASPADDDWLTIVNAYRQVSGLAPIAENATWSAGARNHSCYMLYNGITHDEVPGNPGYTADGDAAGNASNVAVSSNVNETARGHIELWLTGPFHAIGILRHNLTASGYGKCANSATSPWKSGGTLDVIRGLGSAPRPSTPILFPGSGSTIKLDRFVTESPNPLDWCPGYSAPAGLPIVAMMPEAASTAAATLTGPAGVVETCVLTKGNTSGTAQAILAGDNAVVVVPRAVLTAGTYTVSVTTPARTVSWSFTVDPNATLPTLPVVLPSTAPLGPTAAFTSLTPFRFADSREGLRVGRLVAGAPQRVQIAGVGGLPGGLTAISANFTIDRAAGSGYLTVYNCGPLPEVSTLNFTSSGATPNQAVVPLDGSGGLCLYSPVGADIIIDVNGYLAGGSSARFTAIAPVRVLDTRQPGNVSLGAGEVRPVRVTGAGTGVPTGATSVAVNLTSVLPSATGYLSAFPCDAPQPFVSNVNYRGGDVRPNSAIVGVSEGGTICLLSSEATDVLVDTTGYMRASGQVFTPLAPIRLLDTRFGDPAINPLGGGALPAGTVLEVAVAGQRGVPATASAVSVNVTAVSPSGVGFVTAYPCGAVPEVSTLNLEPATPAVANGAMIDLSSSGHLCLYANVTTHLLLDINGVWS
jgi:hypothetical protein